MKASFIKPLLPLRDIVIFPSMVVPLFVGREKYGVFPLKGKLLNVLEISDSKIASNEEITNLKKIQKFWM